MTLAESQHRAFHGQRVSSGRGWILFVAILGLVSGVALTLVGLYGEGGEGAEDQGEAYLNIGIAGLMLGIIYLGLWSWARRQPFPAALTALIIYLTLIAADVVMDPTNIGRGIIVKLFVIYGLSRAVQSGYSLRQQQA